MPAISIIVIARNEKKELAELLPELATLDNVEVIVADGQSEDGTDFLAAQNGCKRVVISPGRARQLNAGARLAQGEILLFVHADCRLERGWKSELEATVRDPTVIGGAFAFRTSGGRPWLDRFLSWSGNSNALRSKIFLGDHSIFVRREAFEKIGGFPDVDLMEDYLFSKKLRRVGRLVQLKSLCTASSRRFVKNGYFTTILQMRLLRLLATFGYSNRCLRHRYLNPRSKEESTPHLQDSRQSAEPDPQRSWKQSL